MTKFKKLIKLIDRREKIISLAKTADLTNPVTHKSIITALIMVNREIKKNGR